MKPNLVNIVKILFNNISSWNLIFSLNLPLILIILVPILNYILDTLMNF